MMFYDGKTVNICCFLRKLKKNSHQDFLGHISAKYLAAFFSIAILAEWGSVGVWKEQSMQAAYDLWLIVNMVNLDEPNRTTQELHFGTKLCIVKIILCVTVGRESTYVIVLRSKVYFVGDL